MKQLRIYLLGTHREETVMARVCLIYCIHPTGFLFPVLLYRLIGGVVVKLLIFDT